ncbi:MAG: 16S rRNA (adenine(1518)-N(6)/adenine(1519)-N(6))-dimethyltransferase, partial [Acholeplasmatales bacterium]|nr:16S rRNA (adenine(1518)-N(6)/adenine(1519)-N(6))-dimethyltransferase [Acholeplasmatales bacterium]
SAVTRLELFDNPHFKAQNEEFFFKLIRDAFCQRRKTLVNNLKQTGYDKELVLKALDSLGLNVSVRSEALDVSDFVKLSDYLWPYHNKN